MLTANEAREKVDQKWMGNWVNQALHFTLKQIEPSLEQAIQAGDYSFRYPLLDVAQLPCDTKYQQI